MRVRRSIALGFLVSLGLSACSEPGAEQSAAFDLAKLQSLLPGDYVGEGSRGKVYHTIAKLELPAFGGTVFYHHISLEGLRGPAAQRKIYRFDPDGKKMKSTVLLGTGDVFDDPQSLEAKLNTLPEETLLRFPDSCKLHWSSDAKDFIAEVSREDCSYESAAFGGTVSPEMTYRLNACSFDVKEAIYRENGEPTFPPSAFNNRRVDAAQGC